jgi:DNA-binding helix-turn-helix protein
MFMDQQYSERMGRHLAKLRQDKGLTQEQLAARLQVQGCDLTRSALAKIEVGQRHLYPDEIKALSVVLGINYEQIFV